MERVIKMALNDFLSDLLIWLRLKKSEEQKLEEEIAKNERRIRELYDQMDRHIEEIETQTAQLKSMRAQYEKAGNAVKEALALKIDSILKKIERSKEERVLISSEINKRNDIVRNQKILLDDLRHPTQTDDIEELAGDKKDFLAGKKEEDSAVNRLNGTVYTPDSADAAAAPKAETAAVDYAKVDKELDVLLGNSDLPSADGEKTKNNDNKTLEEA